MDTFDHVCCWGDRPPPLCPASVQDRWRSESCPRACGPRLDGDTGQSSLLRVCVHVLRLPAVTAAAELGGAGRLAAARLWTPACGLPCLGPALPGGIKPDVTLDRPALLLSPGSLCPGGRHTLAGTPAGSPEGAGLVESTTQHVCSSALRLGVVTAARTAAPRRAGPDPTTASEVEHAARVAGHRPPEDTGGPQGRPPPSAAAGWRSVRRPGRLLLARASRTRGQGRRSGLVPQGQPWPPCGSCPSCADGGGLPTARGFPRPRPPLATLHRWPLGSPGQETAGGSCAHPESAWS